MTNSDDYTMSIDGISDGHSFIIHSTLIYTTYILRCPSKMKRTGPFPSCPLPLFPITTLTLLSECLKPPVFACESVPVESRTSLSKTRPVYESQQQAFFPITWALHHFPRSSLPPTPHSTNQKEKQHPSFSTIMTESTSPAAGSLIRPCVKCRAQEATLDSRSQPVCR